eukprot:TRINITY_DN476_c0_g1_i1.p1 TRINITY_DN476_c0_g1~~TRINITY_DN476_c0_g1_i1.p1  ORF type:complete len:435 (+),score=112.16 TRINITY_DN476_c0_g1_i1:89-1306(+)
MREANKLAEKRERARSLEKRLFRRPSRVDLQQRNILRQEISNLPREWQIATKEALIEQRKKDLEKFFDKRKSKSQVQAKGILTDLRVNNQMRRMSVSKLLSERKTITELVERGILKAVEVPRKQRKSSREEIEAILGDEADGNSTPCSTSEDEDDFGTQLQLKLVPADSIPLEMLPSSEQIPRDELKDPEPLLKNGTYQPRGEEKEPQPESTSNREFKPAYLGLKKPNHGRQSSNLFRVNDDDWNEDDMELHKNGMMQQMKTLLDGFFVEETSDNADSGAISRQDDTKPKPREKKREKRNSQHKVKAAFGSKYIENGEDRYQEEAKEEEDDLNPNQVVQLNVGGQRYFTSVRTLTSHESLLSDMFSSRKNANATTAGRMVLILSTTLPVTYSRSSWSISESSPSV